MLNKDYYILLSMLETVEKIIRYTSNYHSADELYQNHRWCGFVIRTSAYKAEKVLTITVKRNEPKVQVS